MKTKSELQKALTAAKRAIKRHQKKYVQNHGRMVKAKRLAQTWEHEMNFHKYEQGKAEADLARVQEQLANLPKDRRSKRP